MAINGHDLMPGRAPQGKNLLRGDIGKIILAATILLSPKINSEDTFLSKELGMMDIVIKNGLVIDGIGKKRQKADVAIIGDKIVGIGDYSSAPTKRTIDATGKAVCPGFIDPHTHCGNGNNPAFLRQGVTTVIGGNCGFAASMVKEREAFAQNPKLTNLGNLIGFNSVRIGAMGTLNREPTANELEKMKRIVAENMEAGALGVSTGLEYVPGSFTKTEENIELAKVAARYGGYYTSHIRNESDKVIAAVKEAIRIGEESGLPIHVSHLKVGGVPNFGKSEELIKFLDAERKRGIKITFDQYPYAAFNCSLRLLLPPWASEGDEKAIRARMENPETRARLKAHIVDRFTHFYGNQPERVTLSACAKEPTLAGMNLREISLKKGHGETLEGITETVLELFYRDTSHMGNFIISYSMDEGDIARIMRHPAGAVCSDASNNPVSDNSLPHPRRYGTFPRVLGHYCRELKLFPLEEAVRKMTSLPANIVGLKKRGVLKEGYFADITIFDPKTVVDNATFENPRQYPTGIDTVIVNGAVELAGGKPTGSEGGRFLTRE